MTNSMLADHAFATALAVHVEQGASTETVLLSALATYALPVRGSAATANGFLPTGTVATTVSVRPFITETVLSPRFVT
jgi:hypothetical protein